MKIFLNFLIGFVAMFFLSHAQAVTTLETERAALIAKMDRYTAALRANPNLPSAALALRRVQYDALEYDLHVSTFQNGAPTADSNKRTAELRMDYLNDECNRDRQSTYCASYATAVSTYMRTFRTTGYTPKTVAFPQVDLAGHTYTIASAAGAAARTYNLTQGRYATAALAGAAPQPAPTPAPPPPPATPAPGPATASRTAAADAAASADLELNTCEWDTTLVPRKILHGPGCGGDSRICTGYVHCNRRGRIINRLATCNARFCNDASATSCARQRGYGSQTASAGPADSSSASPRSGDTQGADAGVGTGQ